jgi:hypothetical protein
MGGFAGQAPETTAGPPLKGKRVKKSGLFVAAIVTGFRLLAAQSVAVARARRPSTGARNA